MTVAELHFFEQVPTALKSIAEELKELKAERVSFTDIQLQTISDIFHEFKDIHRGIKADIRAVMEIEEVLSKQTCGKYKADTTYNIK